MRKNEQIQAYFDKEHPHREMLLSLRAIVLEAGLQEDFKWSLPTYTCEGRNVLGLSRFKEYCGIWFFQGALLKDPLQVLENAQEGKTKAMRHWKFSSPDQIDRLAVLAYVHEALANERAGKRVVLERSRKVELSRIPEILMVRFEQDPHLWEAFEKLSPSCKREYLEYITEAKRESTRERRLEKIEPMIRGGQGLNDRYRK